MSLGTPSSPNPAITAAIQGQQNQAASVADTVLQNANQQTPFGSLTYTPTETALGIPQWTATQTLNPQTQGLLSQYQQGQNVLGNVGQEVGQTANQLYNNVKNQYGNTPNFLAQSSPLVQAQMQAFQGYMQPFYNMQSSNLNSMLQNQGIPQGSQAWNNAQMGFNTSQDQAAQSALMNFEPQAFNQAVNNYQIPLQTLGGLESLASAGISGGSPNSLGLVNTPQEQGIQPANYAQAAQNNFQNLQNQFQNTSSGVTSALQGLGLLGTQGAFGGTQGLLGQGLSSAASGLGGLFGLGGGAAAGASLPADFGGVLGDAALAATFL